MSVITDQINFMADEHTLGWVSLQTGLSTVTVQRVLDGTIDVTADISQPIRNAYQRDAYDRMKITGFSNEEASYYRSYSPNTVLNMMGNLSEKINYLATGYLGVMQEESGKWFTDEEYDIEFVNAYTQIQEGIRNSEKTYQDWMDYGIST